MVIKKNNLFLSTTRSTARRVWSEMEIPCILEVINQTQPSKYYGPVRMHNSWAMYDLAGDRTRSLSQAHLVSFFHHLADWFSMELFRFRKFYYHCLPPRMFYHRVGNQIKSS